MAQIIGYGRVSSDGQNGDGQIEALKAAGAQRVFFEKESGARSDRPQLRKTLAALEPGDTLLVTAIDRLARSTFDLLGVLSEVRERGAAFKSLAEAWVDTASPLGEFMLTILAGVATLERHMIARRTSEGRKRAREAGVRFGRKPKLTPYQRDHARKLLDAGEPQSAVARLLGVDQSTILRLARREAA